MAQDVKPILVVTADICASIATFGKKEEIEVWTGYNAVRGERLTTGQRVIQGVFAYAVPVLGGVAGSLLRNGSKLANTLRRTAKVADDVDGVLKSGLRAGENVAGAGRMASKGGLSQLVHLTDDAGQFGIAKSGTINGSHGIFAVPGQVARESTPLKVLRTGLMPGRTRSAVPIPDEALELFRRPIPVGPYSGWKFFGGVRYAPAGSLSTATGELARSGSLFGPKVLIYGPDGVFYVGIATAWGLYIYGQTGGGE